MLSFIKESCFLSWCMWLEQLFHIKTISSLCTVDICLFLRYQFSTFIQTQVCSTLVTCILAVGCPFVLSVRLKSHMHQCCGLWQNYCNSNWKIKGFQTLSSLYSCGKGNYYVILIMSDAGMFWATLWSKWNVSMYGLVSKGSDGFEVWEEPNLVVATSSIHNTINKSISVNLFSMVV